MTRLLLDTNILIPLVEEQNAPWPRDVSEALESTSNTLYASVASLWEIAIKSRLGKLPLRHALLLLLEAIAGTGIQIISIDAAHVLADLDPLPDTRDPFDRLLLSQCQVEGLQLVTSDRRLADHRLAWRPT